MLVLKEILKKEIFDYLDPISFLMSEVHFTRRVCTSCGQFQNEA